MAEDEIIIKEKDSTPSNNHENKDESTEVEKLKNEIANLNKFIANAEYSLALKEKSLNKSTADIPKVMPIIHKKVKNWKYILHHELNKLSGLYCSKSLNEEYVYIFDVTSSGNKDSIFGVQFFTNNEEGKIGKKVMPTIDSMDSIISETPIDKLVGVIPFIRNCKRHLDCFASRRKQLNELKENTEHMKNIKIDADWGFNMIIICLNKVYDKVADIFMNLTVYCSYENGTTRPNIITVDWNLSKKPTEESQKAMKSYVKAFKKKSLYDSLREIIDKNHANYSWEPEEREAPGSIDMKAVWDSDDESEFSQGEADRKKKSKKRNKKRKASKDVDTLLDSQQENDEPDQTTNSIKFKKFKKNDTTEKKIKQFPKKEAKQNSMRQSLLNFQTKPGPASKKVSLINQEQSSDGESTVKNVEVNQKKLKAITSTPMPGKSENDNKLKKDPRVILELSPISNNQNTLLEQTKSSVISSKKSKDLSVSPSTSKITPKKIKNSWTKIKNITN